MEVSRLPTNVFLSQACSNVQGVVIWENIKGEWIEVGCNFPLVKILVRSDFLVEKVLVSSLALEDLSSEL